MSKNPAQGELEQDWVCPSKDFERRSSLSLLDDNNKNLERT